MTKYFYSAKANYEALREDKPLEQYQSEELNTQKNYISQDLKRNFMLKIFFIMPLKNLVESIFMLPQHIFRRLLKFIIIFQLSYLGVILVMFFLYFYYKYAKKVYLIIL